MHGFKCVSDECNHGRKQTQIQGLDLRSTPLLTSSYRSAEIEWLYFKGFSCSSLSDCNLSYFLVFHLALRCSAQVWFQNRRSKERRLRMMTGLPPSRRGASVGCSPITHPLHGNATAPASSSPADLAAAAAVANSSTVFNDGDPQRTHLVADPSDLPVRRPRSLDSTEFGRYFAIL
jgi:hypothetical protein